MDGVLERIDEDEEQKTDNSAMSDPDEAEEALSDEKEEVHTEDGMKTFNDHNAAPGHITEGSGKDIKDQANGNSLI